MCGVVGALSFGSLDKKTEKIRQESAIFLTTELIQITQSRGKDATGISTLFADGDFMGLKMGVSASEFITRFGGTKTDYDGYLEIWRKKSAPATITIGHCRKPSTGTLAGVDDNNNNHPIKVGNIVGVHNGTLTNHEIIFDNLKCKRDGKVDSEAIFRLLSHVTNNGADPFTSEAIKETCKRISGQYACLAFNGNNPYQMAAFRDGRPLEIAVIRPLKMVLIASDKDFLKTVLFRYNKMGQLYNSGFPLLKKADADIESLADDSLYLFDVRNDIDENTAVKDLYTSDKILRSEKTWTVRAAVTNTNRALVSAANPTIPPATTTTTVTNSQANSDENETDKGAMAWKKSPNKFVPVSAKAEAEKFGSVILDSEVLNVKPIETVGVSSKNEASTDGEEEDRAVWNKDLRRFVPKEETDSVVFTESEIPVDDLITDPAKIVEVAFAVVDESPEDDKLVVDLQVVDPDIIEKAAKATQEQPNFSSDLELADALEITNIDAMKTMETYSFANRIKSFFFKIGYEAGFSACRKDSHAVVPTAETYNKNMMQRARNRVESNRRLILNLKTFARIVGTICSDKGYADVDVKGTIKDVLRAGGEANAEVLSKVFKPGDKLDIPIINDIIAGIENN